PERRPTPAVVVNDYAKRDDAALAEAEQLVAHFHRIFHQVKSHAPQSRELGQAFSLLASLGLERARYVIEFAKREAEKTNYAVQHFGATLSYVSRAMAAWRERPVVATALAMAAAVRVPPSGE